MEGSGHTIGIFEIVDHTAFTDALSELRASIDALTERVKKEHGQLFGRTDIVESRVCEVLAALHAASQIADEPLHEAGDVSLDLPPTPPVPPTLFANARPGSTWSDEEKEIARTFASTEIETSELAALLPGRTEEAVYRWVTKNLGIRMLRTATMHVGDRVRTSELKERRKRRGTHYTKGEETRVRKATSDLDCRRVARDLGRTVKAIKEKRRQLQRAVPERLSI